MSKQKKPITVLQVVAVSMIAVGAYAAIPGAFSSVPTLRAAAPAADVGATSGKPKGIQIALVQLGPEPMSADSIPLGGVQASPPAAKKWLGFWKNSRLAPDPASGPAIQPLMVHQAQAVLSVSDVIPLTAGLADLDCRLDQKGHRAPMPLDRLVSLIQDGVSAYGAAATSAQIRTVVQADLNRSGDNAAVKTKAVERLTAALSGGAARVALAKPFDLNDDGMVYANGYDPCGNPAAIGGGSGFGQGPFAGDFQTINPVPVVATKLAETAEGGSGA